MHSITAHIHFCRSQEIHILQNNYSGQLEEYWTRCELKLCQGVVTVQWYCSKSSSAESSSPAHKTNPTFFWWTGVSVKCSFTDFPRIYINWITGMHLSGLTISHTRGNIVFHIRKASTQTLYMLYENISFRLLLVYLFCSRQDCKCNINYWFSQYKI